MTSLIPYVLSVITLLWQFNNLNADTTAEYKAFQKDVLSKANVVQMGKRNWYQLQVEYQPMPDDIEDIKFMTTIYLRKDEADKMDPANGANFVLLKRQKSDKEYPDFPQSKLAGGKIWTDPTGKTPKQAQAKTGIVELISDKSRYVYDITPKSHPGQFLQKGDIGVAFLFGIAMSFCQQVGVEYVTLDDASYFETQHKYDGTKDKADSKILRAFQEKYDEGLPSIYSKPGFIYKTEALKENVVRDMKTIHDITATQVMDAITGKSADVIEAHKKAVTDCFRNHVNWRIKKMGTTRVYQSFTERITNFAAGMSDMWMSKKKNPQDII